ncbi:MAG: hypothetical protein JO033_01670 [Acidobacteriaceae bacterium]|nr:hypothetical protein [Acidobacteriaceae bacterium]MBV9499371.1 hypothetical protein [Acidobacteriaceae bacterium]
MKRRLPDAARSYLNLQMYPDNGLAYNNLANVYHEGLFDFQGALRVHEIWLQRHPTDVDARANNAECAFSAGRFSDAALRAHELLGASELDAGSRAALRAIEIAALIAQQENDAAQRSMQELVDFVSAQPPISGRHGFGTAHFTSFRRTIDWPLPAPA